MTLADFWKFYRAAVRRKWLMGAVIASTMAIVGAGCLVMPRYFRSVATVMPSDQALQQPVIAGSVSPSSERAASINAEARSERLANLIFLAQSESVLSRAAKAANLQVRPAVLGRRVTVDTLPKGGVIRITVLDKDPRRSIRLANAIAGSFADFYRELSHSDAMNNRKLLERELDGARSNLDQAQAELTRYRAASGGAGADFSEAQPAVSPTERDRDTTEAELRETSALLAAARSRLRQERPTMPSLGAADSPTIAKLQIELYDLEGKLSAELATHTEKHPNVISLRAQVQDLQRRLATETERGVRNPLYGQLVMQVAELNGREKALQARLRAMTQVAQRERSQYAQASSRGVQLAALTREYRIAEDTYSRLKSSVDQARVDEKVSNTAGAIQVVDLARTAVGPVTKGPSPAQLLLLGLILSVGLAVGLVMGLDVLDDRVNTTDDVMRLLQLPVTGIIPGMEGVPMRELPLVTQAWPNSPYAEAYRFLRTDLLFTCEDQPLQTLCVVTPKPGQGGTTTIANLAISLAEAERSVILVDGDLRRPSLHRIFGLPNEVGLTSVLTNGTKLEEALQETHVPNLRLLTGGPAAPNPSNLISSNRMRALMAELKQHADFVLFDTPSAIAFSDAAIIASIVDGALMVVRARQPLRGSQVQVGAMLNKAHANIVGVVLNDVAPENVDTYYFHSHYYSPKEALAPSAAPALPASSAAEASETSQPEDAPTISAEKSPHS